MGGVPMHGMFMPSKSPRAWTWTHLYGRTCSGVLNPGFYVNISPVMLMLAAWPWMNVFNIVCVSWVGLVLGHAVQVRKSPWMNEHTTESWRENILLQNFSKVRFSLYYAQVDICNTSLLEMEEQNSHRSPAYHRLAYNYFTEMRMLKIMVFSLTGSLIKLCVVYTTMDICWMRLMCTD